MNIKRNFRTNFPAIRKKRGLTQKAVAIGIGRAEKTVSRWMAVDGPDPDLKSLLNLCKLLDCTVEELVGDPGEISEKPKGPITIVLSGMPDDIVKRLNEIQQKWTRE